MFSPSDIYTSRGSNIIYGCWTPEVSKYDTSSFYNWEQDNLPLLDIEERTHLLWERLGHPTSSLTGFEFVVASQDFLQNLDLEIPPACNTKISTDLSSCINKLPEVINAPYLIEVLSYGELGTLRLANKTFGPRGSIEIINRNFAKAEPTTASYKLTDLYATNAAPYNVYGLASSVGVASGTESVYSFSQEIPSLHRDFVNASSIILSSLIFSSTGGNLDVRLTNNLTVFAKKTTEYEYQRTTAALAAANPTTPWTGTNTNGRVSFTPYELNPLNDQITIYDASTINEFDNTELAWKDVNQISTLNFGGALAYGNRLSKIEVFDCDGPVIIRNFTIDGGGSVSGTAYGIQIKNSNGVHLENCSVARCNRAGLLVEDSSIIITRGFFSYRNYSYTANNTREGLPWNTKIRGGSNTSTSSFEMGAGILALNSNINFSSTVDRDTLITSGIVASLAISSTLGTPVVPGLSFMVSLSRNTIGLHAINSRVFGGQRAKLGFCDANLAAYNIHYELNTEAGIKLENSQLEFDGRIISTGNYIGLDSYNSDIDTDQLIFRLNQKVGCKLTNSSLRYNKGLYQPYNTNTGIDGLFAHHNSYTLNGTHIKLENSTYEPYQTSSMPTYYDRFLVSGSFGRTQDLASQKSLLPGIVVNNSSKLVMVHAGIGVTDNVEEDKGCAGMAIAVTNNSELVLQGSKKHATKIIGPTSFSYQKKKSGLYANNNSSIKIQGPTVIAKFAIDALADNNSIVSFEPHVNSNGRLDVSGFDLVDSDNHTMVELHATRACLVANNGSIISMKDLGDYSTNWARGSYGAAALLSGLDYDTVVALGTPMYTSGGSMQMFPNPNDASLYELGYGVANPPVGLYDGTNSFTQNGNWYYYMGSGVGDPSKQSDFSAITFGGMCVRAVNGSKVNVLNTHFPAGFWVPSATVYDASGRGINAICERLFIWNIADSSYLNAKFLSVSGLHPADAGYFGPSGTWNNLSAAPQSTPDTGAASILDYYGRATNHSYGKSTATNQGPFRLYFSIDPVANWLLPSSLDLSGYISQVFSQGYNFSGDSIAPGNVSSFYTSVLKNNNGVIQPSGFYYASAMVMNPTTIKALLDDSAANTFANAKHNSVGKSGLARVVSIYFPYTDIYGGDSAKQEVKNYGKGLRSVNSFDLERDN